ncbi:MAG: prepilin-type N-terminal cleavage/methylation domain-containing protein [Firmicutes bacterium]|nr:prepilin-type N-terminal cleavage/methylation domain-containing protein [Bacillota bacterium]
MKKNAFTILEMMIVLLVIVIILLITLPNIQQKEKIIRAKGCSALIEIVNSQIMLYEINEMETPSSVSALISGGYLKQGQDKCPDGTSVVIVNGQAESR